jgi:hypothetical protein
MRRATLGPLLAAASAPLLTPLLIPLLTALLVGLPSLMPATARAQAVRPVPIPVNTLRGEIRFGMPPEIVLNDKVATRLSPATRIRGQSNTLVMSASLSGQTWVANYTLDTQTGWVQDVWLLSAEEAGRRWPQSREEAAKWSFDPISQTWSKP